jgi:hypothetical protein
MQPILELLSVDERLLVTVHEIVMEDIARPEQSWPK